MLKTFAALLITFYSVLGMAGIIINPGGGGTGTVTSVQISGGTTGITASGGPITTSGTITLGGTLAIANGGTGAATTSQNFAFIGPTSGSGAPSFRAIVAGDIPILTNAAAQVLTGFSASAGTVASTDTVLGAFNKEVGNVALKAPLASPAFTSQVTFGNYHLEPCENDSGNSGTTKTLDLSTCAVQKSTLTGSVTYTLSNPVTGGSYLFKIVQGASSYTVTWPGTVLWSGGTAPTITVTNGKTDLVNLYWDGTSYYGSFIQNF